jgi:hypothetical protein
MRCPDGWSSPVRQRARWGVATVLGMDGLRAPDPTAESDGLADAAALRRTVLMVCVLDGVDVEVSDEHIGVQLYGAELTVGWDEVARAVGGAPPESSAARSRLLTWWRLRARLASLPDPSVVARPVGLPVGHVLHPGGPWVRHRVLGGALEVGIGFLGLLDDPDEVVVPPAGLLSAAGLDDTAWWPAAARYLEEKGRVAGDRLHRDPRKPLRPIGDCDVVTLLASPSFRRSICGFDAQRMRSAAVPMRRRGWLDLSRIDPAFAVSAAAVTDPVDRGFERPVLITCEEVAMAPAGGNPVEQVLSDPAPSGTRRRR